MRAFLIRHGQTEYNLRERFQGQRDVPLNATGRAQVRALAERLRDVPFVAAYASDLIRVRETAEILLAGRGVPLTFRADLREIALGPLEGLFMSEVAERYPEALEIWGRDPSALRLPGDAEELATVQARVVAAFEAIAAAHEEVDESARGRPHVLIVGHGTALTSLTCHLLGLPLSRFRRLRMGSTGLTEVVRREGSTFVERINDRAHLDGLRASQR